MFTHKMRVYADDTDYCGIVYHAHYLKFMEHARTEWLEQVGLPLHELAKQGYLFVIRSAELHYLNPARLNDYLEISCKVIEVSRTQAVFQQEVRSSFDRDCIYANGVIKLVCTNTQYKPVRIPELLQQKMGEIKYV